MQPTGTSARRISRPALAVCLAALLAVAWVSRLAVDDGGGYFSNREFRDWSTVVGAAAACFLAAGVGFVRRPVGRGILLGTVLAVLLVGCAVMVDLVASVTTGPY